MRQKFLKTIFCISMGGYVGTKYALKLNIKWNFSQNVTFPLGKNSKIQASISKQNKTLSSKNNTSALFPSKKCSKPHNRSLIYVLT